MVRHLKQPDTSCRDWDIRLQNQMAPINETRLPLETPEAERFSSIYGRLVVPDIDGTPMMRDLPNFEWQDNIGRALFGGSIIKEAMVLTPKKSSKTSGGALMYLAANIANKVRNQSSTILAPTVGIAGFAFNQIMGSIKADAELDAMYAIRRHTREIENLKTNSTITIKPSSLAAVTGLKGSVFVDELHVLGAMKDGQKLRQQLRGALAASPSARGLYITTQSDSEPAGLFSNMLRYARAVRDGLIKDPTFLPVLYEPWKGADPWNDPSVWPCIMPSYPHIADQQFYEAMILEANQSGATAIAEAKSQFFNIQIGHGEAGNNWHIAAEFSHLTDDNIDLEELLEQSERVSVGIDLGGSRDLTALVVLGVRKDGSWIVWCRAWLTKAGLKHNSANESRFTEWKDAGNLIITNNAGEDVPAVVAICLDVQATGKLSGIGVDPAGAADLVDALEDAGFVMEENLHGVGQTAFRLAPGVRTLERRVDTKRCTFANQPIIGWALGNVVMVQAGNAPSVSKDRAKDRIDPVMALLDAAMVEISFRSKPVDVSAMIA